MAGWLVLLVVTNVLTLAAIAALWRRQHASVGEDVDEVFTAPRPSGVTSRSRRLITIEVLNPIELVGTRGRFAGLAGSLAPGLARRVVYDQVLKTLRRELAGKQVVADVRLHHLRAVPRARAEAMPEQADEDVAAPATEYVEHPIDEVSTVDLDDLGSDQL